VPGWSQKSSKPLDPALTGAGLVGGTQVTFETAIGDSVGNTVACFDSTENAEATYAKWGSDCLTDGRQEVPVTATVGDSVKVVFCPAGTFAGADVAQSLSLYSILGTTVISVTANGETYPANEASVAVLVRLANAVIAHLNG